MKQENERPMRPLKRALHSAMTGDDTDYEFEYYFKHSATLRVIGDDVDFELITSNLGITSTHQGRKG